MRCNEKFSDEKKVRHPCNSSANIFNQENIEKPEMCDWQELQIIVHSINLMVLFFI